MDAPQSDVAPGDGLKTALSVFFSFIAFGINAGAGFYVFAVAFNGPITTSEIIRLQLFVGIPIGLLCALLLKRAGIGFATFAALPFAGFLGLFVLGAMEKGSLGDVGRCVLIAALPIAIEVGICWCTLRILRWGAARYCDSAVER